MNVDKRFLDELEPVSDADMGAASVAMDAGDIGGMGDAVVSVDSADSANAFGSPDSVKSFDSPDAANSFDSPDSANAFGSPDSPDPFDSIEAGDIGDYGAGVDSIDAGEKPCGCADVRFLDELSAPEGVPEAAVGAAQNPAAPSKGAPLQGAPTFPSAYDVARDAGLPMRLVLVMNRAQDAAPRDYLLPEVPGEWRVATVLTHERLRDACHRWGVSAALMARINLMNPAGYVYPGQRFLLPK